MRKRFFTYAAFALFGLLFLTVVYTPCEAKSVIDYAGRHIRVPDKVTKILALACTLREAVYLLGEDALKAVVGIELRESAVKRAGEGKWPAGQDLPYIAAYPDLQKRPVVRCGQTLNFEKIAELGPDVIFTGPWEAGIADKIQAKTGIPVVVLYVGPIGSAKQLDAYFRSLELMGDILGRKGRALELRELFLSYLGDLKERTKGIPDCVKPKVYIAGRAYYGAHGILGTDPKWPPFEWVFARNVAGGAGTESKGVTIDKEELLLWDPDVIFVSSVSLPFVLNDVKRDPSYRMIKAVKTGQIYEVMPYCWFAYNKEMALADAYFVGKVLYPDRFSDVDPDRKAEEIFVKFLGEAGRKAYSSLKRRLGGFRKVKLAVNE